MIRARVNLLIVCGFRARVSAMLHSHWPDICSLSHSSRSCLLLEAVRLLLLLSLLLYQYCSNIHQSRPHAYPQNSLLSVVVYVIIVLDKSLLDLGLIFFHLSLSVTSIFFHFLFIGEGIPLLWGISYKWSPSDTQYHNVLNQVFCTRIRYICVKEKLSHFQSYYF